MTQNVGRSRRGRILAALVLGLGGVAILVSLGLWQLRRAEWKTAILMDIESRIAAAPVALPAEPDPVEDRYLPVRITGRALGKELHVLTSIKDVGAGYRVISGFETQDGRSIMVDEGFIRSTEKDIERPGVEMAVTGNLHWPDETDSFTPTPDIDGNIWFARDVALMAEALETEPVLVIARTVTGADPRATPIPLDTVNIPNNHMGYAIQWFGLACVWAGMTAFLIWRIQTRDE